MPYNNTTSVTRITNPLEAFEKCKTIAASIHEPVMSAVALDILEEKKECLLTVKGSDWQHHNYAGGLIVHICNVAQISVNMGEFYEGLVSLDMIKFCALLHDMGKCMDYEEQTVFENIHSIKMNQALLGHSFEGAFYVAEKLRNAYNANTTKSNADYIDNLIVQVSHCIGAHMDGFGACAKQQMFEVLLIGCADKMDAYLEQTVIENNQDSLSFIIGTGEIFYKSCIK